MEPVAGAATHPAPPARPSVCVPLPLPGPGGLLGALSKRPGRELVPFLLLADNSGTTEFMEEVVSRGARR